MSKKVYDNLVILICLVILFIIKLYQVQVANGFPQSISELFSKENIMEALLVVLVILVLGPILGAVMVFIEKKRKKK